MMKITVSELPEEGLHIDSRESVVLSHEHTEPVAASVRIDIRRDGSRVRVRGEIETSVDQVCSRCLAPVRNDLRFDFTLTFEPKGLENEGHELRGEELEVAFYEANSIDMTEMIREQIMINMPMKPLCADSCGGICPACGVDRNEGACNCASHETDERWKILSTILSERKA